MNITFAKIGNNQTVDFAYNELKRILKQMDPLCFIDGRIYEEYDGTVKNVIWLGLCDKVEKNTLDDSILIDVKDGVGVITGSNYRSVLIAAYRFLKELGCAFLRPGKDGEVIPCKKINKAAVNVFVKESASYRHRGVCIEGATAYEHVENMIDFLPKVAMNGYFFQFLTPTAFFRRFYNRKYNPYIDLADVSEQDIERMVKSLEVEISKRGLDYHATGHGWTCMPFGINANGWDVFDESEFDPEILNYMAEIDGKRGFKKGVPLNTNLCYSNPVVRNKMTDSIVEHCKKNPQINYMHFWLADGTNGHCECEECKKKRPSDFYVETLNELDKKLTAAAIDTKIVCLIYVDLLWAPEQEKIENPDRFVLMFAPITRTYSTAFADCNTGENIELPPYVRNKLEMPKSVSLNLAMLKKWQNEQLSGDSFDFDYHLMWDHLIDPGYYSCAKLLHKDMANLDKIGLNGMMSCQGQRVFLPTGLPFYSMAAGLWDKKSKFEDVVNEYFTAAFGDDAKTVESYLASLSEIFDPVYMRREKKRDPDYIVSMANRAIAVALQFQTDVLSTKGDKNPQWRLLKYHAPMVIEYAKLITAYLSKGSTEEIRNAAKEHQLDMFYKIETETHDAFDAHLFRRIYDRHLDKFVKETEFSVV